MNKCARRGAAPWSAARSAPLAATWYYCLLLSTMLLLRFTTFDYLFTAVLLFVTTVVLFVYFLLILLLLLVNVCFTTCPIKLEKVRETSRRLEKVGKIDEELIHELMELEKKTTTKVPVHEYTGAPR